MKKLDTLLRSKKYRFDDRGMIHFVLTSMHNSNPVLPNAQFPAAMPFPGRDVIIDPETRKQRKIRLIPGEGSIFADEQSDPSPKADSLAIGYRFSDGYLSVRKGEEQLLEFLILSNANIDNADRVPGHQGYYQVFSQDDKKEEIVTKDELVTEAKMKLIELCKHEDGLNQVKSYAMVLGVNINQSIAAIKHDLNVNYVSKNPEGFLSGLNDANMKRKFYVKQAIADKILVLEEATNSLKLFSTGATIAKAGIGIDIIDYFVEQSHKDAAMTYDMIKDKVNEQFAFKKESTQQEAAPIEESKKAHPKFVKKETNA